jgi:hypothetical protein
MIFVKLTIPFAIPTPRLQVTSPEGSFKAVGKKRAERSGTNEFISARHGSKQSCAFRRPLHA